MYTVMIVDDEATIREKLPRLVDFERHGFRVCATAKNGAEALEYMQHQSPDLVFLDVRMPVMDGLTFLQSLTEQQRREVAVVILSGYSDFQIAKQAMALGAKGYLTKPVDVDEAGECLEGIARDIEQSGRYKQPACCGESGTWLEYVDAHYREPITIKQVAEHFHMNPAYLGRAFQKAAGTSFKCYLNGLRIKEAKKLLRTTDMYIYQIAEALGFSESSYFITKFTQEEGISPVDYRKGR